MSTIETPIPMSKMNSSMRKIRNDGVAWRLTGNSDYSKSEQYTVEDSLSPISSVLSGGRRTSQDISRDSCGTGTQLRHRSLSHPRANTICIYSPRRSEKVRSKTLAQDFDDRMVSFRRLRQSLKSKFVPDRDSAVFRNELMDYLKS